MICHNCKKKMPDDSKFCRFCGAKAVNPQNNGTNPAGAGSASLDVRGILCPKCRREVSRNSKFCPYCATQLNSVSTHQEQTTQFVRTQTNASNSTKKLEEQVQTEGKTETKKYLAAIAAFILVLGIGAVILFMRSGSEMKLPSVKVEKNNEEIEDSKTPKDSASAKKREESAQDGGRIESVIEKFLPSKEETSESAPASEPVIPPAIPAAEPEYPPAADPREPEPAAAPAAEPWPEPSPVLQISPDYVRTLVDNQASGATWAFAVQDMTDWEIVGSDRMDEALSSSALLNIPILYTVACMNHEGTLSLDTPVRINRATSGRTMLTNRVGQSLTIQELISYMLQYSDNTASNTLMEFLTFPTINEVCSVQGYTSVSLNNYILSTTDYTANDNYVSCADLCGMLTELYTDQFVGIGSQFLRENMVIQDAAARSGLGLYAPASAYFMNLNGQKTDKYNEVAIVDDNNGHAYVVAFMGSRVSMDRLTAAAQSCGQYIYEALGIQ